MRMEIEEKRVTVKGTDMVRMLVSDRRTDYPLVLNLLDRRGGASHVIYTREELRSYLHSIWLDEKNLVSVCRQQDGMIGVDLRPYARLSVDRNEMPEIEDGATLGIREIRKYCFPTNRQLGVPA